jgi:hypothetical protein
MKYFTILFCLSFSISLQASIYSPEVTCESKLNSASCGLKNPTASVLACEFLVVGETVKGELITNIKNNIILPYDNAEVEISSDVSNADHIKYASGEANCTKL